MQLIRLALLAFIGISTTPWSPNAQSAGLPKTPAKVFGATPGSNTLMVVRDAVRAWRAEGHAKEAAVISLLPGDYTLTETLKLDSQDSDVTWNAGDKEKVLVTGGERINNFEADRSGIWHAHSDYQFEQLYVNGRRATRNRLPIDGFFRIESVEQTILPDAKARITIKFPTTEVIPLPTSLDRLQTMQIVVFHKWDTSRYSVSSADASARTITVDGKPMQSWNPWDNNSRFIIDNCEAAKPLASGMWFLDQQGELSYCPLQREEITKSAVIAPVVEKLVEIRSASNLHFNGVRFNYSAYRLPRDGCPPAQAASTVGAAIEIDDAQDVTFTNCEIGHTGSYGIWFRQDCHQCRVEHSLFSDLGAGGIRIGEMVMRDDPKQRTDEIVANNNIIAGCGRIHASAVGIWIGQSANNRITHNDIGDTFYTGISVGWSWGYGRSLATNNFIGYNRIHQIGQGVLSDMGGIYTLGVSPGSSCVGNVIYNVRAHDYGGWGIYPDEGSTGWRIESNLVWNCTCVNPHSGGAFHQHYGATNFIANNIFAFSSGPPMQATRAENHRSFTLERNLIVSSDTEFFTGPWNAMHFESRSNCFVCSDMTAPLFPNGHLSTWQDAGHEAGSILTNFTFNGVWPDVTLPRNSPALSVGFKMFDTQTAGVYGEKSWKKLVQPDRADR